MPLSKDGLRIITDQLQQAVDMVGHALFDELEADLELADAERIASALARVAERGFRLGIGTSGDYIVTRAQGEQP